MLPNGSSFSMVSEGESLRTFFFLWRIYFLESIKASVALRYMPQGHRQLVLSNGETPFWSILLVAESSRGGYATLYLPSDLADPSTRRLVTLRFILVRWTLVSLSLYPLCRMGKYRSSSMPLFCLFLFVLSTLPLPYISKTI